MLPDGSFSIVFKQMPVVFPDRSIGLSRASGAQTIRFVLRASGLLESKLGSNSINMFILWW